MRPRLVSLVGRSPGTLHTVLCLLRRQGLQPGRVDIVATSAESAAEAERLARSCPCPDGLPALPGDTPVEHHVLPYGDVDSQERLREFRRLVAGLVEPGGLLDATGGRKAMSIAAAIEAAEKGATVLIAHIPWSSYLEKARARGDPCAATARPGEATLLRL